MIIRELKIFRSVIFIIFIWVGLTKVEAQPFPVSGHVQLSTTHLPYIEDYLRENPARLSYTLILNDLNRPNFDVVLRVSISGDGINLRTRNDYVDDVVTLERGAPYIFNGFDLSSYFNPDNLNFSGITREEYITQGRLPEGFYSICIEAYDINRLDALPVSNTACGMGIIEEYDPPVVIQPIGIQAYSEVQNILIQWQPSHVGMFPVEYNIYIFEKVDGLTDDQVIELTAPYSIVTSMSTSILYGPDQPILLPHQEYLIAVEINDLSAEYSFKNNGRSKIEQFSLEGGCVVGTPCDDNDINTIDDIYLEDCICSGTLISAQLPGIPVALEAMDVDSQGFTALWVGEDLADYYLFDLAYDSLFIEIVGEYSGDFVEGIQLHVSNIDRDLSYFYRVRAANENGVSEFSNVVEVSRESVCGRGEIPIFECGLEVDIPPPQSQKLIKDLKEGDEIFASDFKVVIDDLIGNNPYSGRGHLTLPFSDKRGRVNVRFSNILISDECRMIGDGYLEVTGAGVKIIEESTAQTIGDIVTGLGLTDLFLLEVEGVLMDLNDLLNIQQGVSDYFSQGWNILDGADAILNEYPYLDPELIGPIDEAVECYKLAALTDADTYSCEQQLSSALSNLTDAIDSLTNGDFQVLFKESPLQSFGYDKYDGNRSLLSEYNKMVISGSSYDVPWKSVEEGQRDEIIVDESKGEGHSIRYEYNDQRSLIPVLNEEGEKVINLEGEEHNSHSQVYAIQDKGDGHFNLVGKLNLATYRKKEVDVVIIPVNGVIYSYDQQELQSRLDDIFSPAIAGVNLDFHAGIEVPQFDGVMDNTPTGFLSNYTDEMDAIIEGIDPDGETFYLFIVGSHEDPSKYGYMPRGRKYGFIYNEATSSQGQLHYEVTIAHEIAHGAFKLGHIYEDFDGLGPGETDNLMDYGGGDRLYAYQWDFIHNPERNWSYNDDDEEGEAVSETVDYEGVEKEEDGDNLEEGLSDMRAFYTIAGQIILVPVRADRLRFMYHDHKALRKKPQGALIGFNLDGKQYYSWYTGRVSPTMEIYTHLGFWTKSENARPEEPYRNPTGDFIGDDVNVNVVYFASECEKVFGIFPNQVIQDIDIVDRPRRISSLHLEDCIKNVVVDCDGTSISDDICWTEGNNDIDQEGITACVQVLMDKMEERSWETDSIRPKERLHHIISTEGSSVKMPSAKARILDEKLYLLQYHTGIKFNIVYHKTDQPLSKTSAKEFSRRVGLQAGLEDRPVVLVVVPYQEAVIGIAQTTCGNPGLYDPRALIQVPEYEDKSDGVWDYCMAAFKWIKKPLNNGFLVYLSDESVMTFQRNSITSVQGYESINNYKLFRSRHWDIIRDHRLTKPRYDRAEYAHAAQEYLEAYEIWEEGLLSLEEEASIDEVLALSGVNSLSTFNEEEGVIRLRESYMSDLTLQRGYALYHYDENNSPLANLKEYWGEYDFVDSEHLHDDISISELVFTGIDVVSLALAPVGLDFLGDLLGITFAVLSDSGAGRYLEYGAGIFVPAIIETIGETTYRSYKYIRHIDDRGEVAYRAVDLEAVIEPSDVWLGSIKATNLEEANRIASRSFAEMNGKIKPYYESVVPVLAHHTGIDKDLLKQISDEILLSHTRFLNNPSLVTDELAQLLVMAGEGRTNILGQLSGFNDEVFATFTEDLAANRGLVEAMSEKVELVGAWKFVRTHKKIRNHINTLQTVSNLILDQEFLVKLPNGADDLTDIIKAAKNPLIDGTESKLVMLSDHLENVQRIVINHSDALGFDLVLRDLKEGNFSMQDGISHMINDVAKLPEGVKVTKFDYEFDGDGVECSRCRFDVELEPGPPRLIEYKSWSLDYIPNISSRQLTEYFRSATSIDDIRYVFNKMKTPDLGEVKSQMKIVLQNNLENIFEAMSDNFRVNILGAGNQERFDLFEDLIEDLESKIYKIIEIR